MASTSDISKYSQNLDENVSRHALLNLCAGWRQDAHKGRKAIHRREKRGKDRRSKTKEGDLLWLDFMDELANEVEQDMPATLSDFVACVTAACESDLDGKGE